LVPFQGILANVITLARYNPGFWAQGVLLGIDDQDVIRDVGGGGIRIAVPISGYAAFGWFGAIVMSFCAGFLTGYLVRFAKNYAGRGSIEQSAAVIAMYLALSGMALVPSGIEWYQILQPLTLVWLIYPVRFTSGVLTQLHADGTRQPAFGD
jgi:hypothetical protein